MQSLLRLRDLRRLNNVSKKKLIDAAISRKPERSNANSPIRNMLAEYWLSVT